MLLKLLIVLLFIMNISLQHLRLVDTIVKTGTLTKASSALHLTQSALSHQLKELERELGTSMFKRKGKSMELSEEGKRFLLTAHKVLTELQLLEDDLTNFKNGKTGKLNISTQCYTAYHWLPAIIKDFKDKSPDINIHILSEATHNPLDYLLKGDLDVGIVKTRTTHPNIYYKPIFEDQLMVIMSQEHALAKKEVIKIKDFQNEELILSSYNDKDKDTVLIENLLQMEQITPKTIHRILYTDAIIEMVSSGLAIGVMANWIIQPYLATRNIAAIPLPSTIAKRTWYAATSKNSIAVNNFLDCLKLHFSNNSYIVKDKYTQPERTLAVV